MLRYFCCRRFLSQNRYALLRNLPRQASCFINTRKGSIRARKGFPSVTELFADPWFYAAVVPAVILVGLSKGGLGGGVGVVGVPMMALTISPVRAAAILLPILVLMDL